MRKVFLIASAVWAIFLTSCSKDNDTNDNITANNPPLLKKLSLLTGADSLGTVTYTYDNLNRVSTAFFRSIESGTLSFVDNFTFHYASSDSLPDYFIDNSQDLVTGDTYTAGEYFYYDASRRMIKDSLFEVGAGSLVYQFQYFPSYIKVITDFGDETRSYQTISNGNIIQEKDTITRISGDIKVDIQQAFDNKINPLFRTQIKRPVLYLSENFFTDYEIVPTMPNNATSFVQSKTALSGNTVTQRTYTYTYNADNTPATVIINDLSGGGSTIKGIYQYY